MPPLNHRKPGLAAAVLESDEVTTEIVCDGVHVHPAMVRLALSLKGPSRVMVITDGTGGSGLAKGARASIGGRPITVKEAAYLDDGTLAGSTLTMDRAFANVVTDMDFSLVDAALACSTTPAHALGLQQTGAIVEGWGPIWYCWTAISKSWPLTWLESWLGPAPGKRGLRNEGRTCACRELVRPLVCVAFRSVR